MCPPTPARQNRPPGRRCPPTRLRFPARVARPGLTRTIESLLFGVRPTDPATLAAVVGVLALVAILACYLPARRATNADPMEALRQE